MRFFFRSRVPEPHRVLIVESGSRWIMEKAVATMRTIFAQARFDLCTCFPESPAAGAFDAVFRVTDAHGLLDRLALLWRIRRSRPAIAALLWTGESILFPWKILLLLLLPAKILVVNENGDFFWLDWSNRATLRNFIAARAGVDAMELFRAAYRLLVFPFALMFLALNALVAYTARWFRLLFWRLSGRS